MPGGLLQEITQVGYLTTGFELQVACSLEENGKDLEGNLRGLFVNNRNKNDRKAILSIICNPFGVRTM